MRRLCLMGMVYVYLLAGQSQAVLIDPSVGMFTLLSEKRLFTGNGVEVYGLVGATDDIRLGRNTLIDDDIYTNGRFKAAPLTQITGNLIVGEDIKISNRVKIGMIDGFGKARVGKQSIIFGDITLGLEDGLRLHPQAMAFGTVSTGSLLYDTWAAPDDPPEFLTGEGEEETIGVSQGNVAIFKDGLDKLEPGTYGKIKIRRHAILTLTAGTYFFDDLILSSRSKLVTDTIDGPVIINISGKMRTSPRAMIEKEGDINAVFNVEGRTRIGACNTLFANIITSDRLFIGHHTELSGFYYSKGDMRLGRNVNVVIPEPVTFFVAGTRRNSADKKTQRIERTTRQILGGTDKPCPEQSRRISLPVVRLPESPLLAWQVRY